VEGSDDKTVTVRRFDSRYHQVVTIEQTKRALSLFDDKRIWLNRNTSVAYGHYLCIEKESSPSHPSLPKRARFSIEDILR
jgi:hypothetical protein